MAASSGNHRSYCRTLVGAAGGSVAAADRFISDRNARAGARVLSDLRVVAPVGALTSERRDPTPSASKLLVAERSA